MNVGNESRATLADRVDHWLAALRIDAECVAATQYLEINLTLSCGEFERTVCLGAEDSTAAVIRARIGLSAPGTIWEEILCPVPRPGRNSFGALQRQCSEFHVDADPLDIARALHVLERAFEIAHELEPNQNSDDAQYTTEALSQVTGRHSMVRCKKSSARIFYEHSGTGTPLVMLHTAGSDSRQYLDMLIQPRITDDWSCYAFDMPLHGRSSPSSDWAWGKYRLTMSEYIDWCLAFIEQVVGEPAVVLGCSMGASISIALAATKSDLVKAVVALEAPDKSPGRLNPYLNHPAVNSAEYNSAYVRGLMSPTSPLKKRQYASWVYSQGGPGIYAGDLWFYSEEYNGLDLAPQIDTTRCPVHLLTGAYDYSGSPEATQRLHEAIPGSSLTIMPELGHFPMTEDPARFLKYLAPVLDTLRPGS